MVPLPMPLMTLKVTFAVWSFYNSHSWWNSTNLLT